MQFIVRRPARYGVLVALAVAVALLALLGGNLNAEAVHNEGMLELDGNVKYEAGAGFDPGTNNCPFDIAGPDSGDPDDCISNTASFDWADNTVTSGAQGLCKRDSDGYITEASPLPSSLPTGASLDDIICQADFYQTGTSDTSYHRGSDKDYQDISAPGFPSNVWGCLGAANATNKADLLNAYFAVTTVPEGGVDHQVVYFGAERDSEHGDVFNGFWILQGNASVPTAATGAADQLDCTTAPSPKPFGGTHVCGDVLILFNYESGGRIGKVGAFQWDNSASVTIAGKPATRGCDGKISTDPGGVLADDADNCNSTQLADGDTVGLDGSQGFLCIKFTSGSGDCRTQVSQAGDDLCGRVNGTTTCTIKASRQVPNPAPCSGPGTFSTPWEPNDGSPAANVVQPPTFSEVGVDLTGLHLQLPCIAGLVAESRSSPSSTATLKDFVSTPTGEDCASGLRTEIHDSADDGTDIQGTTVIAGTGVHDHAFVTPTGPGGAATGTVTYTLFSNTNCDAGVSNANVISTETVTISPGIPSGTESTTQVPASSDYTTTGATPAISYSATYNADAPYTDSTGDCEPLNVEVQPSISTDANASAGHVGDTLQDTATLSGGSSPTGSITFKLFAPGVDPCDALSTPAYTENVTVDSGNGAYSTVTGFIANAAGTWEWTAHYSGDLGTGGPNRSADSPCPDTDEQTVIINPSTSLVKTATPSVVTTVVYGYAETNDGDDPLTSPAVNDDQCGAAAEVVQGAGDPYPGENTGDDNGDGVLDPGETWNFTCTQVYNGTGTFTNIATGTAIDSQGFTVFFCGAGVTTVDNVAMTVCDPDETDTRTVDISVTVS